jgi:outer membrane murein-binding lipoprotein Lpp
MKRWILMAMLLAVVAGGVLGAGCTKKSGMMQNSSSSQPNTYKM